MGTPPLEGGHLCQGSSRIWTPVGYQVTQGLSARAPAGLSCSFGSSRGWVVLLSGAGWGPNPSISWPLHQTTSTRRSTTAASLLSPTWPLWAHGHGYFQIFRKLWGRQVRPTLVSLSGLGGTRGPHLRSTQSSACQNMPFWLQPEARPKDKLRPEVRGAALEQVVIDTVLVAAAACHCPSVSSCGGTPASLVSSPPPNIIPTSIYERTETQRGKATSPKSFTVSGRSGAKTQAWGFQC